MNGKDERGFSLMEILITVAVLGTMMALATGLGTSIVNASRADSALVAASDALEVARNRAISERRDFQIIFVNPNQIQVARVEIPGPSTTTVSRTFLENNLVFNKFTGLPDTPDAFGNTTAVYFGSTPTIRFTSDGSLLDSSGDVINGTILMGEVGKTNTARALTIYGASGLIHSWKWNGRTWDE